MHAQGDIYQEVTSRIVEQLEKGVVPWRRPWSTGSGGMPQNVVSARSYRGVNVWLLTTAQDANGWGSSLFATYRQWQNLGGHVRKGEHGTRIVHWQVVKVIDHSTCIPKEQREYICRRYVVFNLDQCGGEALDGYRERTKTAPFTDYEPAERAIAATGAQIIYGGSRAFYSSESDHIALPHKQCFDEPEDYYSTALHEVAHWTGHPSRLNRLNQPSQFGDPNYATEELIGEMASSYLTAILGVKNTAAQERSASYLAEWLAVLRADNWALFCASSAASKAADFVLAFSRKPVDDEAEEIIENANA